MKHRITIQPKGLVFEADENETILDAAANAGIKMLKSCDNGICEVCRATLLAGVIDTPEGRLTAEDTHVNPILPCVSKANSELILQQKKVLAPGELPIQHIACQITDVTESSGGVYIITLLAPAGKIPTFHAGQYLELLIDDNQLPFTIACAPGQRELELHLGVFSDNKSSQNTLAYLQNNATVRVRLSQGEVWVRPNKAENDLRDPLIFIVAGTGFAQAKAMIEEQLKHQHSAMYLYWINRDGDGFYSELAQQWADENKIHYLPMTPEAPECEYFSEKMVEELIAEQFPDTSSLQIVTCGGPGFVYSVLNGLESKGITQSQTMSDVYAYMPRPKK
ncbi:MAG: CDP-4-dehydro-6-deoxyglucose reductase [Psychrobacter glaciei]|jgi:CDP-4-dehydro-6-deoxyglucose reductase